MSGGQQEDTKAEEGLIFLFVVVVVAFSILSYFPAVWNTPWAVYRGIQFAVADGVITGLRVATDFIGLTPQWLASLGEGVSYIHQWLWEADRSRITAEQREAVNKEIRWLGWTLSVAVIGMGVAAVRARRREKFYQRRLDFEGLLQSESSLWGVTRMMATKYNPLHAPINDLDDPWAMGARPAQYAYRHGVLKAYRTKTDKTLRYSFDAARAREVLLNQMGALWTGESGLSEWEWRMYVLFIGRIARHGQGRPLLRLAAFCGADETPWSEFDEQARAMLHDIHHSPGYQAARKKIARVIQRHAWNRTVLAGLFDEAKRQGVFGSCEFLWLKPQDRALWYTLNNIGRRVGWMESAGVWVTYLGESSTGRRLPLPPLEKAIRTWRSYIPEAPNEPGDPDE